MSTIQKSFPQPVIKEAVLDPGSPDYCIYYDQLDSEGARLEVSYPDMTAGQEVRALEQGVGSKPGFDERKLVVDGFFPLVFKVPKRFFSSPRLVQFQYLVFDGSGGPIGSSAHATYIIK